MGQQDPYSTEGGKYYIYEGGSIFLIFYDHQDTESKSQWMVIGVAGLTLTHKCIKLSMGKWYNVEGSLLNESLLTDYQCTPSARTMECAGRSVLY